MKLKWIPIAGGGRCLRIDSPGSRVWISFENWDLVVARERGREWRCWSLRESLGLGDL